MLRATALLSHTETQVHATGNPSDSSFNFELFCGLILNRSFCLFGNLLLLSNPSWVPLVGSRSYVQGELRLPHVEQSFWLVLPCRTLLLYGSEHVLVVVIFVVHNFRFCFDWNGILPCNLRWPQTIIAIFLPHAGRIHNSKMAHLTVRWQEAERQRQDEAS